MIPHNALVVVADGTAARFFRNTGQGGSVSLSADGKLKPPIFSTKGPRASARRRHLRKRLTKPHSQNS